MKNKLWAFALLSAMAVWFSLGANAAELGRGYDWTVTVRTEPADHMFQKSNLSPVEKVDIRYYKKGKDEKEAEKYQKLWYHKGMPIGLERLNEFKLDEGESVRILVSPKKDKATPGENQAAANVILRLWLDTQLNKNHLTVATVKEDSLQPIANELSRHRLSILQKSAGVETPNYATMTLFLKSDSSEEQIRMGYFK